MDGIHAILSSINFFEIKNRHISLDRLYELNPDILVDLNCFDLKNSHSIVVVIIDL